MYLKGEKREPGVHHNFKYGEAHDPKQSCRNIQLYILKRKHKLCVCVCVSARSMYICLYSFISVLGSTCVGQRTVNL